MHRVYQLIVAAGAGGLAASSGIALAGSGGVAGTDYTADLKWFGPTVAAAGAKPTARLGALEPAEARECRGRCGRGL